MVYAGSAAHQGAQCTGGKQNQDQMECGRKCPPCRSKRQPPLPPTPCLTSVFLPIPFYVRLQLLVFSSKTSDYLQHRMVLAETIVTVSTFVSLPVCPGGRACHRPRDWHDAAVAAGIACYHVQGHGRGHSDTAKVGRASCRERV